MPGTGRRDETRVKMGRGAVAETGLLRRKYAVMRDAARAGPRGSADDYQYSWRT